MLLRRSAGELVYYVSPLLESAGVPHAFSTRAGGVSPPPFDSLNLGLARDATRQDSAANVAENYRRLIAAIGCAHRERCWVSQVHAADVCAVRATPSVIEAKPVLAFDYNAAGLELAADGQRMGVVEKRYDAAGWPFSVTTIDYEYDALNRLTREVRDDGDDGPTGTDFTADYTFDLAGNRTKVTTDRVNDADDEVVEYDYDDPATANAFDDRLYATTAIKGDGTASEAQTLTTYAYDADGSTTEKAIEVTPAGGPTTVASHQRYLYDARNRLVRLDADADTTFDGGGVPTNDAD